MHAGSTETRVAAVGCRWMHVPQCSFGLQSIHPNPALLQRLPKAPPNATLLSSQESKINTMRPNSSLSLSLLYNSSPVIFSQLTRTCVVLCCAVLSSPALCTLHGTTASLRTVQAGQIHVLLDGTAPSCASPKPGHPITRKFESHSCRFPPRSLFQRSSDFVLKKYLLDLRTNLHAAFRPSSR